MKKIFDEVSNDCSKIVTKTYSTSFSLATKMLSKGIRQHIYNIYGFVRFARKMSLGIKQLTPWVNFFLRN